VFNTKYNIATSVYDRYYKRIIKFRGNLIGINVDTDTVTINDVDTNVNTISTTLYNNLTKNMSGLYFMSPTEI
jgi:hypothetical protein